MTAYQSGATGAGRLKPGDQVANYMIERYLARGGMAVLYQARDVHLQRRVALKLISPDLASDERFRGRFIQESHLAASLDHPNIIPIFAAGEEGELLYLAMRYVEGMDMAQLLDSYEGPAPAKMLLGVLQQAAAALDTSHDAGLVHRDVKPANILVAEARPGDETAHRHVYLTDFGLTKRTSSLSGFTTAGHFIGSIEYVAPEQIKGETVGPPADLYSLACVAYRGLTGSLPHPRDNHAAIMWGHISEEPAPVRQFCPWLRDEVDQVISTGLAKDPTRRPESCSAFVRDLAAALELPQTRVATSVGHGAAPGLGVHRDSHPGADVAAKTPRRKAAAHGSRRKWALLGAVLAVIAIAVLVPLLLVGGNGGYVSYNATEPGAPVFLKHPSSWQEHPHDPIFMVLSPIAASPLFESGDWAAVKSAESAKPQDATGVYLRITRDANPGQDVSQAQQALGSILPAGSKVSFTDNAVVTVAGKDALRLDGSVADAGSSASLQFRAYLISAGPQGSDTMAVVFFALPKAFAGQGATFDKVLSTVTLSPSA